MATLRPYKPAAELDFTKGGDNLREFMRAYNTEMQHIYDCLNDLLDEIAASGDGITVDAAISRTSANPVQNKAISAYLAANYYTKDEFMRLVWGI